MECDNCKSLQKDLDYADKRYVETIDGMNKERTDSEQRYRAVHIELLSLKVKKGYRIN